MARTVAKYLDMMRHAIGNDEPASGVTLLDVLNDALVDLFAFHPWSWSTGITVSLNYTIDQSYINLPTDFSQLVSIETANALHTITATTLPHLQALRHDDQAVGNTYFVALSHPGQTTVTGARPQARLEIWPTPTATETGALSLVYRSKAVELSANTDVPNIPRAFEEALTMLARGKIKGLEMGDYAELEGGRAKLAELSELDGLELENLGQPQNTAAAMESCGSPVDVVHFRY